MDWMSLFKEEDYTSGVDKELPDMTDKELFAQYYISRKIRDSQLDDMNAYAIAATYYEAAGDTTNQAEKYAKKHRRRSEDVTRTERRLQEMQLQFQLRKLTPIGGFIDPFAD